MRADREPTKLVATKLYTTFQLCCCVFPANSKYSAHEVFNIVLLYIMEWFRYRAGDDKETTDKLTPYPNHDSYQSFDLSMLPDIKIRESFTVNTLFLKDRANWSLRISEPDNHAEFEGQDPGEIIIGRSFITNIALQECSNYVTLSYKCACKEATSNKKDCEVFRPSFIKTLCRDENLIIQELPETDAMYDKLCEQCIIIGSNSATNRVATELISNSQRQLPVLLFTGDLFDETVIQQIASSLVGFCHVFSVPAKQFNRLFRARLKNDDIEPGDTVLFQDGLNYEVIEIDEGGTAWETIVPIIQRYPVRRNVNYRGTLFYREAKTAKFETINSSDPTELLAEVSELRDLLEIKNTTIQEMTADANNQQEQLRSAKKALRDAESSNDSLVIMYNASRESAKQQEQITTHYKKQAEIRKRLLNIVLQFPLRKEEFARWVRESFSHQLILLDRAEASLLRCNTNFSIRLLCCSIVYLNAYVLFRRKQISETELDIYSIGRPWLIEPCGENNVKRYSEYKIDLSGFDVKEKTDFLDFHLKSGNNADNLLRVYFSINEELDRIVIGHLPDHLPIESRPH